MKNGKLLDGCAALQWLAGDYLLPLPASDGVSEEGHVTGMNLTARVGVPMIMPALHGIGFHNSDPNAAVQPLQAEVMVCALYARGACEASIDAMLLKAADRQRFLVGGPARASCGTDGSPRSTEDIDWGGKCKYVMSPIIREDGDPGKGDISAQLWEHVRAHFSREAAGTVPACVENRAEDMIAAAVTAGRNRGLEPRAWLLVVRQGLAPGFAAAGAPSS
jgi:hypothetical protein